jgi:hypothetical protein
MRFYFVLACAIPLLTSCATYDRTGLDTAQASKIEQSLKSAGLRFSPELEEKILVLDPEHVTGEQVSNILGQVPAPRIINIHGGIYPVHLRMVAFSEFLVGMGYPRNRIQNPGDGTYTFSCYESSELIAGMIAWYYEKEGLRPMIVGHSQGAMQAVKILDAFAGKGPRHLAVWNPLTWKEEKRTEILDPLGGTNRPVVGLTLPYVTGMGGGGLTRMLPNQWDMAFRLRTIPDSVEDFTGFYKGKDLLGGDFLGYGPMNRYKASGTAHVRNVRLPSEYKHGEVPDTVHLLKSSQIRDWLNNYKPADVFEDEPHLEMTFDSDAHNILWAEDVWYSIKKHWVLELQRAIRARRALHHD